MENLYFTVNFGWEIKRIKDLLPKYLNGVWGEYSNNDSGIPVLRSTEQNVEGKLKIVDPAILDIKKVGKNNTLKNKDLLLTKSSGSKEHIGKCSYITSENGEGYCFSNFMMGIRFNNSVNSKFLQYCINNIIVKKQINNNSLNITLNNLTNESVGKLLIPYSTKEQQTKIANYLDTETSKFDRKISNLEKRFEKLEEYKQSVIFETVTKGLNSNVAMKYSGIDWIGDIPSHWEIKRVKDTSKIKKGKAVETFFEKDSNMLPCIDTNFLRGRDNVVYCSNGVKILSDKVLILWDGANAGELFFNKDIGYLGSTFGVFNTTLNNQFWFYYLKGIEQYSRDNLTGMGIPHVDGNVLKQTIALVPSKQEQELIVNFLNIETSKIDKKKEIIKKQIELLKEYKQTIIYEAVTGKKEIL